MKKIQLICYNQLNQEYLYDDIDIFVFLHSQQKPNSPYGKLNLHPISQQLEIDMSQNFVQEISGTGKQAIRQKCEDYTAGIEEICCTYDIKHIVMMTPNEPQLEKTFKQIAETLVSKGIILEYRANTQFLITHQEFLERFPKPPVMESFYRRMREKFDILMVEGKPEGGKRNYDSENRKFDKNHQPNKNLFGGQELTFPTTRQQALVQLEDFLEHKIHRFGELEDAMYTNDDTVYHSCLSVAINFGLLTPQEVIKKVADCNTQLNNKEGFIRQVLGRREYMYHWFAYYQDTIYSENQLNHIKPLPSRFWRPDQSPLKMHCINHTLKQVKTSAYSHHITRLMIIGNFTLLMGFNPHDVNKRFWEMYADAFERVVTPNVLGMSQFVDGGKLATKPYISSANYINNMSDYCKSCHYDPKLKEGPLACPFNYLYRNFIDKHPDLFKRQPYITNNLSKVNIDIIRKQAEEFITSII